LLKLLFLVFGLGVCLAAVSGQSFWIDETLTAIKARTPSLAAWWDAMVQEKASDLQMPLYMVYTWACEKIVGSGEWALRMCNVPWFLAGLASFCFATFNGTPRRFICVALVCLFCPFAWSYLDEARPYAMQLGASFMVFGALIRLDRSDGSQGLGTFLAGLLILCGSSLLGMVWGAGAVVALAGILGFSRLIELVRSSLVLWLGVALLAACLAGYYLFTLKIGARASISSWSGLGNLAFVPYELFGFVGLGPGRLDLRSGGLSSFRPYWMLVASYALVVGIVTWASAISLRNTLGSDKNRRAILLTISTLGPAAFIVTVGFIAHFRALGRHFSPLIPVIFFILAGGLLALFDKKAVWCKVVACCFLGLSLVSCLNERFASRHKKDDYRSAAEFARAEIARGATVWWSAAESGAAYYQLSVSDRPGVTGSAQLVINQLPEDLKRLAQPNFIIASKPDIYDNRGALANYVKVNGFRRIDEVPAFVFWRR
jgi:hypothetical protein